MLTNKQLVALATALFAQESLALNVNRHGHNHAHKGRALTTELDLVVVTDWTTVTVTVDGSETTTSVPATTTSSLTTSSPVSTTPTSTVISTTSSIPTTSSTSTSSIATTSAATVEKANAIVDASVSLDVALTSTSTSAAAASTTASTSTSSSLKRGLAYNDGSLLELFLGTGTKCGWSYNWGFTADSSAPSSLEYVPMLWSPSKASGWDEAAEAAITAGSEYFLSFNECDNSGQCNLDAASAATSHQEYMNTYSGRVKIGTPAITNSQTTGEGIEWLTAFLEACDGACDYDFCPFHWYNTADVDEFLSHASDVYAACGKDVWVTEFAPTGTDDEINTFLTDLMDQLDNNATYSFVTRYAYFMVATSSLVDTTALSTYGETYAYE